MISPFLSPARPTLKKFDKSFHINYNIFVAKKGCLAVHKRCDRMVMR